MKRLAPIALIALLATAVLAGSAEAKLLRIFDAPDHNIGCALYKGSKHAKGVVRCDISQHTWIAPAKTKSCPFDYGNGAELRERGFGHYECASDSLLGSGPTVAVGVPVTKGRFTCVVTQAPGSAQNGVHCFNRRNQHGFDVSQTSISFF